MRRNQKRSRKAGFTLVEIMIAMLIGMIGIVVIMQTFAVSEGFKRTATSGTDAQINGSIAMYMLERDIRTSGYAMNSLMEKGCVSVRRWFSSAATGMDMHLYPVEINPLAMGLPTPDAGTDAIVVIYGNTDSAVDGTRASQAPIPPATVATAASPFVIRDNVFTWKSGDIFVSVQPDGVSPGVASCVMHQVSSSPASAYACGGDTTTKYGAIYHDAGAFRNFYSACNTQLSEYNKTGGILDSSGRVVPVVTNGYVFNLGGGPVIKVYMVQGGNLTLCDWGQKDCKIATNYDVVVNDIVSLRAVYGMDLTPPIDYRPSVAPQLPITWTRASLNGNAYLPSRTMAVALEVTARSGVKEKYNGANRCDITPDKARPDKAQDWMYQSLSGAEIDLSQTGFPDWDCYRYKLYQNVVPIRNTTWRPYVPGS